MLYLDEAKLIAGIAAPGIEVHLTDSGSRPAVSATGLIAL